MPDAGGLTQARPGAVLKEQRLARGWTLADVSARTGLPVSTLSKVENDKISLTYDKLVRLSQGLGIDISRLFGGADAPQRAVTGRRSVTRSTDSTTSTSPSSVNIAIPGRTDAASENGSTAPSSARCVARAPETPTSRVRTTGPPR